MTGRLSIFSFATAAVAGISSAYRRCRKQWHRRGRSSDRRSILGFAAVAIGISVGRTARHEQREHQCCDFHDTPPRVRTNEGKSCRCVLRQIGRFTACEINSSIGLLMRSASICGPGEPFASLSSAGVLSITSKPWRSSSVATMRKSTPSLAATTAPAPAENRRICRFNAIGASDVGQSRQKSLKRVGLRAVYLVVCVIDTWPSQSWIARVSMPSLASL